MTRPMIWPLICMLVITACLTGVPPRAGAVEPDEILSDPGLEARARALSRNIRCLVCQNQSIDDSDADLARDLRQLVRARLIAGDSDPEIEDFLVARYGDFILLRPPMKPETWFLWFAPVLVLGGGIALILLARRQRRATPPQPLDEAEARHLADLLREDGEPEGGARGDGTQKDGPQKSGPQKDGPA